MRKTAASFGVIFCILFLAILAFAGCATRQCLSAHELTARKGYVLHCETFTYQDTGEVVDECTYLTARGEVRIKKVLAPHCGL